MTHHVTCTLYGPLREIVGTKSLEREIDDEATAGGVFDDLVAEYPDLRALLFDEDGTFSDSVSVMKNGRNVAFEDGVDTALEDGDTLSASPPAEGGSER
ncbi:ubiquitin-like small modifier protein 1 [Natronolimnobius baerhuensis]|uniref:Molybdopterin synthase sulfur carrier subunit n=1 Tax=Natronolimnobius baerhuensis TaxID=253108 RepID=A0A202EC93_9EURY|nr:ubiquitin-like small modifier protein 1 [Natronolimnobius baerhuensis]OVE85842.1 molybdopterin synthase sulfur carrier subunit [Natronolimnobius baerhuensis]